MSGLLEDLPNRSEILNMKVSSSVRWALASAITANGVLGFQYPDCVNGPLADNTVCDTNASPPDRAAALVKAMKVEEKLENLVECVIHINPRLTLI
jgi:beta-D-xylosidase 4